MKVLHVMPCVSRAYGGPTQSLVGYAQAAQTAGIDVTVAAPEPPPEDARWLREQLPDAAFELFDGFGSGAFCVAPALFRWLWREGAEYDVVHTHGLFNPTSSLAARLCVFREWPLVLRPFGTLSRYTFSRRTALKRSYFRLIDRPTVQRAAGLHFTTAAERDEAARLNVGFRDRAFVAPPPFRGAYADPVETKAPAPTALFLSRLHPKKNVEGLLEAWQRVAEARPEARLVVAGDGEASYVRGLKREVRACQLSETVSLVGFVKGREKQRHLASAHVFVLPSHQENFGVAVVEGIAAGLPVVISPQVQLSSFVEQHRLGTVVERDPGALAGALLDALADGEQQARCRTHGPACVKQHFSARAVGRKLERMYRAAVRRGDG